MFLNQISYGTVRIETQDTNSRSSGTGFFFHFNEDNGRYCPAIVTNRHVLEGQQTAFVNINTQGLNNPNDPDFGKHAQIRIDPLQRFVEYHPNPSIDLALIYAMPILQAVIDLNSTPFYRCSGKDFIARPELIDDMSFVEPILMVGYPNGLWDNVNNLPLIRQGITATPIKTDFVGRPEFVIDCACFPGSSGSPVYLNNSYMHHSRKRNSINMAPRHALLGILYAGPQHSAKGDIIVETIPTKTVPVSMTRLPNNLGYCLHARLLDDFEPIIAAKMGSIEG